MNHDFYEREDELSHCKVCGGAEGDLPSACPGRVLSEAERNAIMAGQLDFRPTLRDCRMSVQPWVPLHASTEDAAAVMWQGLIEAATGYIDESGKGLKFNEEQVQAITALFDVTDPSIPRGWTIAHAENDEIFISAPSGSGMYINPSLKGKLQDRLFYAMCQSLLLSNSKAESVDGARYRKLRSWMGSNVATGWGRVIELGAVCAWMGWGTMDQYLDSLPECNVGQCGNPANRPGEVLGADMPDWPEDLETFAERKAYQRGVAAARAMAAGPSSFTSIPQTILTLDLPFRKALADMGEQQQLTETQVMKQALRLYQVSILPPGAHTLSKWGDTAASRVFAILNWLRDNMDNKGIDYSQKLQQLNMARSLVAYDLQGNREPVSAKDTMRLAMGTACRTDGRCQEAIDRGAEHEGACPVGKCAQRRADGWPADNQECSASGAGCSYRCCGPKGESQCQYCGKPRLVGPAQGQLL